ncbi:MAG: hypothetical protein WBG48_04360, partial [Pricia sp.]
MKIFRVILVVTLSVMFFGCFSDDDAYRNTRYLSISDAIVFDNQENYVVGDTLFFELEFSRYLPEEGYTELLDIFETSASEVFGYSFGISKFSTFSNNFEFVNIAPEFILATRLTDTDYFGGGYTGNMAAQLNEERSRYTSKVGIILVEEGRYALDFSNITFSTGYHSGIVNIDIYHT